MNGLNQVVPVQDVVCSGLGAVERLSGGLLRFYFYIEENGEKIVAARVIMPAEAVPDGIVKSMVAIGGQKAGAILPLVADIVH